MTIFRDAGWGRLNAFLFLFKMYVLWLEENRSCQSALWIYLSSLSSVWVCPVLWPATMEVLVAGLFPSRCSLKSLWRSSVWQFVDLWGITCGWGMEVQLLLCLEERRSVLCLWSDCLLRPATLKSKASLSLTLHAVTTSLTRSNVLKLLCSNVNIIYILHQHSHFY